MFHYLYSDIKKMLIFPNPRNKRGGKVQVEDLTNFFFSILFRTMVKRTRADKRLATVTAEYGEQQIVEERKALAQQASDTDLFYMDSGKF